MSANIGADMKFPGGKQRPATREISDSDYALVILMFENVNRLIMKTVNIFAREFEQKSYLISPKGSWQVNAVLYLDNDDFKYVISISKSAIDDGTQTRILDDAEFALIILRFF